MWQNFEDIFCQNFEDVFCQNFEDVFVKIFEDDVVKKNANFECGCVRLFCF